MKVNYVDRKNIESIYSTKKYVQTKTFAELPKSVKRQIKLISLPIAKTGAPFGSYVNRMSDYYGDIDVIQLVDNFINEKKLGEEAGKAIQEVVKKVNELDNHWYSEVKAGIDRAYFFDIGKLEQGVYRISKKLKINTTKLRDLKLLDDAEFDIVMKIADKIVGNGDDYDVVFNLFRNRYLLRWTYDEVMRGWKETSLGKYKLEDAVLDRTAVKIDMIILSESNRFIEVTNFIALAIKDGDYFKSVNVDKSALTPDNLPFEIEKLYYSNYYYNPFKAAKRCFSYLKYMKKNWNKESGSEIVKGFDKKDMEENLEKYVQILQTSVNILYTVKSEIEAMQIVYNLYEGQGGVPSKINKRLDLLREPLANVLEFTDPELREINFALSELIQSGGDKKRKNFIDFLDILRQFIDFWTIAYFDQLRINPPPKIVLPSKMLMYDPNIVREPWHHPINPFKILKGGCLDCGGVCGGSWFSNLGSSIFQKAANAYRRNFCNGKSRPLMKGEYHYGCHNFTGPGTRVDLKEVRDYPPYNNIDACSRKHDEDYVEAVELPDKERIAAINKADKEVIKCYDKYPKENGYNVSKMGINSKMSLAKVLPTVSKSIFGKISASGKKKKYEVVVNNGKRELNMS